MNFGRIIVLFQKHTIDVILLAVAFVVLASAYFCIKKDDELDKKVVLRARKKRKHVGERTVRYSTGYACAAFFSAVAEEANKQDWRHFSISFGEGGEPGGW